MIILTFSKLKRKREINMTQLTNKEKAIKLLADAMPNKD